MEYAGYENLLFERKPNGVLLVTINRPERKNAITPQLHHELATVWTDIAHDDATRAVVVTGAGDAFCAGGDLDYVKEAAADQKKDILKDFAELMAIPETMMNLDKPIVSAINGAAVAGGAAVALMADVSVAAEDAFICDGHVRGALVAGDHSALIWPLLCGMAKAKYFLMTGRGLKGREAERIGLVSLSVPLAEVLPTALKIAEEFATGPQLAVRWTKRALNGWLRQAQPIFEHSAALEQLSLTHPDVAEAMAALLEKRKPVYPSAQ